MASSLAETVSSGIHCIRGDIQLTLSRGSQDGQHLQASSHCVSLIQRKL